jgi:hypothetical protein
VKIIVITEMYEMSVRIYFALKAKSLNHQKLQLVKLFTGELVNGQCDAIAS